MKYIRFWMIALAVAVSTLVLASPRAQEAGTGSTATVHISSDGRALDIKRATDSESIRVAVLDHCGDPAIGPPQIRHVDVENDKALATYGKHCWATISLKTLAIECSGCD